MPMKFFRQRPIKGGRDPLPSCVMHSIRVEIEKIARKHHVSKSFVVATELAKAFGIDGQEDYEGVADARAKEQRAGPPSATGR